MNPINVLDQADSNRPNWICRHPYAKVVDREEMIYSCGRCCKYGTVKIIADEQTLLRNLGNEVKK